MSAAEFSSRYWAHRDAYDSGLGADEYWRKVIDGANLAPGETGHVISELSRADCDSWTLYRDDVWTVAAAFKDAGGRTAILSNGPPEVIKRVRSERPVGRYFDVVIVSCEVGCSKPDPAIYRLCLDRLGVAPHRLCSSMIGWSIWKLPAAWVFRPCTSRGPRASPHFERGLVRPLAPKVSNLWKKGQTPYDHSRRHLRLQLSGVARHVLSGGPSGEGDVRLLLGAIPHRRDQLHVLPHADAEDDERLAGAGAGGVPLRAEGAAAHHARSSG